MEKQTSRIYYLDLLRAIATFSVIFIHVAGNNLYGDVGTPPWITFLIYSGIVKFCVPIFFMISGALFLDDRKVCNIKRLYTHNILRLVIFLLFWSLVYQFYNLLVTDGQTMSLSVIKNAILQVLSGNTQIHFWFVYAMIGLYMIVPVLKCFLQGAAQKHLLYFLVLCLIFGSLYSTVGGKLPFIQNNVDKLNIHIAAGYTGYFLLGHYLVKYPLTKRGRTGCYVLGVFGLAVSIVLTWYVSMRGNAYIEDYCNYTFCGVLFWSMAVFTFFQTHGEKLQWCRKAATAFSKYSFGIYAVHMLILYGIFRIGLVPDSFCPVLCVPVIALICAGISLLLVFVLSKIPFFRHYLV